jgi:hypothetical protein
MTDQNPTHDVDMPDQQNEEDRSRQINGEDDKNIRIKTVRVQLLCLRR